jgi:hypothetical protein
MASCGQSHTSVSNGQENVLTPFGRWLLVQHEQSSWVGRLAQATKVDPKFPKDGSPDDVRKRLSEMQAEGEMFEALDDAERDWSTGLGGGCGHGSAS